MPGGEGQVTPTCYRHPARETWIRCTRCERPICPDCMRSASVGYQCPTCVAEGAATVRAPRTTLGGRVTSDTSRVCTAIVAVNVVIFVLGLVVGEGEVFARFAKVGEYAGGGIANGEVYRLLTAAFLHAGFFHILLNMFALASLGPMLESELGRLRFTTLYVLSALGGSVLSYLLADPLQFGVGASGAIHGLFGAYYVVGRRVGRETSSVLVWLAISAVVTLRIEIIDWRAHVGGLVVGTVLAVAFAHVPRGPQRGRLQALACAAVALVLAAAVVARTGALGG